MSSDPDQKTSTICKRPRPLKHLTFSHFFLSSLFFFIFSLSNFAEKPLPSDCLLRISNLPTVIQGKKVNRYELSDELKLLLVTSRPSDSALQKQRDTGIFDSNGDLDLEATGHMLVRTMLEEANLKRPQNQDEDPVELLSVAFNQEIENSSVFLKDGGGELFEQYAFQEILDQSFTTDSDFNASSKNFLQNVGLFCLVPKPQPPKKSQTKQSRKQKRKKKKKRKYGYMHLQVAEIDLAQYHLESFKDENSKEIQHIVVFDALLEAKKRATTYSTSKAGGQLLKEKKYLTQSKNSGHIITLEN